MFSPIFALPAARFAAALALAFLQPGQRTPAADSQKQAPPLRHEVVVTANRLETPAREVASSVTVLTKTALERSARSTVFEALESAPGLTLLRNGGWGGISTAFIRGANSEHVLVTLDGLPANDPANPSRSFDFAHLSLDGVERVEILRGPQSPLYGSDAVAGAVNILTARGSGRPRLSLRAAAGSHRTLEGSVGLRGASGPVHFAFGLSRSTTDGISAASSAFPGNAEKDAYRNTTFSGRLGAAFEDGLELDLIVRTVSARTELDNFGGPYGDDPNHVQDYASGLARLQGRFLAARGRWEQKVALSLAWSDRTTDNPDDPLHPGESESGRFRGVRQKAEWQHNLFLNRTHTLTLGLDAEREAADSAYRSLSSWGESESFFPRRSAGRVGAFVQDRVKIGGVFFAAAGARYDEHDRAGGSLTFRLAPAILLERTGTKLKATVGTGFKAPSLYQLYAPATSWGPVGNSGLKPERSLGWDAGFEQTFGEWAVALGLVYFRTDFQNLVDFDFGRGYVNVGRARTRGIEVSAEARIENGPELRLSYTRLEALDLGTGAPLPRRPKDKVSADLAWAFAARWDAGFSAVYAGPRPDRDYTAWPAAAVTLDGFLLLGARASFDLGAGVQAFLRLDNILSARAETVFGYGAPGFTAVGGFRLGR